MKLTDRKYNAPLMMPISEKYKDMGAVVVGKLESGKVSKGEAVMMMPNKVHLYQHLIILASRTDFDRDFF